MWHTIKEKEVLSKLHTSHKGLTTKAVEHNQEQFGKNVLDQQKKRSLILLFLSQFQSFIIYILIFAVIISIANGEWVDAIVIIIILFFNAIFGFIQEYRAGKAIDALKRLAAFKVEVLRDNKRQTIDAEELVPGDIIFLSEGNKIPADARLLEAKNLQVVESALTGESVPSSKSTGCLSAKTPLAQKTNMIYSGTAVTRGKGLAVIVQTGMQTELGKIAGMISEVQDEQTPLQKQLDSLGKKIGIGTIVICILVFILGILHSIQYTGADIIGYMREWLLVSVSLAVAAVPEGLPAVVTIALAIGVKKMIKEHALIRKLPSVETLGEATVICSDKTGTITTNQMTVRSAYINGKIYNITGSGFNTKGSISPKLRKQDKLLFEIGLACNDARLETNSTTGDPTEAALLVSASKAGLERTPERVDEIPFDSDRKLMSTLHKKGNSYIQYTKGAPERVLNVCTHIMHNGKTIKLTKELKTKILKQNEVFAKKALRVLGFAYTKRTAKTLPKNAESKLIFVGLQGMIDPPHPEVKDAVATCKQAGIRVIMITGDNPLTASAIAKEIGLNGKTIEGDAFAKLSREGQIAAVKDVSVFARVEPRHKMQIVTLLQEQGEIVAMTGDGVNDAPAIRKADLGISMGISGTDVSKEASKMVLMDDNFTSIVKAISEGRGIYQNIKKFVNYLLSCNLGEVFVIFFAILFGWELPMTAIMLLWLNLVTDGLPALALAVDPYGKNLMKEPPLKKNAQIMDRSMLFAIFFVSILIAAGVLGLFWWAGRTYAGSTNVLAHMQTIAFTGIIVMEIVRLQAIRSEYQVGAFSNKWLIFAVLVSIGLQLLVIYTPLSTFFGTVPLTGIDWIAIIGVSLVVWGLNSITIKLKNQIVHN